MSNEFFAQQKQQSKVKSTIVLEYFKSWFKIMLSVQKKYRREERIAYLDLYSGPGLYNDGSDSTPLLILKEAAKHASLRQGLVSVFTDKDPNNVSRLTQELRAIEGIDTFSHKPDIYRDEVDHEIISTFKGMSMIPTLLFADPYGYKGLSLELVNSVLKDWGCECIFFFNFNRINSGISNPMVKGHMDSIFGESRANDLRANLSGMKPAEREAAILEKLTEALTETFGKYVLRFKFKHAEQNRTSHYLIFVTKNVLGYDIMKPIIGNQSTIKIQGVPTFEFDPDPNKAEQLTLFRGPMDTLLSELPIEFAGRSLTMRTIYAEHNIGTNYISKNYKDALTQLKDKRLITVDREPGRPGTFADGITVTFPDEPPTYGAL